MNGRNRKLVDRFLRLPIDFRWLELVRLLALFGYWLEQGGRTSGSVRHFVHDNYPTITVHKPHPGNIIKPRTMRNVLNELKERGLV